MDVHRGSIAATAYALYIQSIDKNQSGARGTVAKKKEKNKDSQLILRLDKEERDQFVALCKELDTSAAREIRHFIRKFIKENG